MSAYCSAFFSYVWPDWKRMNGFFISSSVIGHMKSSGHFSCCTVAIFERAIAKSRSAGLGWWWRRVD